MGCRRAELSTDTGNARSKRIAGIALIAIRLLVVWILYWYIPLVFVSGGHQLLVALTPLDRMLEA
jgi:hypothetical protein